MRSRGGADAAERAQYLIQVRGDGHLVVEEVLKPHVIVPVRQCHQGQQLAEADAHRRLLSLRIGSVFGSRINAQLRDHARSSLCGPDFLVQTPPTSWASPA